MASGLLKAMGGLGPPKLGMPSTPKRSPNGDITSPNGDPKNQSLRLPKTKGLQDEVVANMGLLQKEGLPRGSVFADDCVRLDKSSDPQQLQKRPSGHKH